VDRGQRGIRIRGNSIQIEFMYQGIRCRETLPMPPTKTGLKEIALKRQAILYEIKTGQFDYLKHFPHSRRARELRKNSPERYTIAEGLNDWLQRIQPKCQASTLRDYRSAVYYHLIPKFGSLAINELTVTLIKNWLAELPCCNKRKNNILIPLRQLYADLYADEVIDRNPLDRIKNLPISTRESEPFSSDEISCILDKLQGQERNLIQFSFWSGLRTSELIALRWEDVDLKKGCIHVRAAIVRGISKQTKTAAGMRQVTLQPQAAEALQGQLKFTGSYGIVFHDSRSNRPWQSDQAIRKAVWTPALQRAGLKYRNPYQTRHTFASILLSRGENPLWVAQQMGHKDWGMIRKVYGRWIT
jgi:integrase